MPLRSLFSVFSCTLMLLLFTGWHLRQGDTVLIFLKNTRNPTAAVPAAGTLLTVSIQPPEAARNGRPSPHKS